MLKQRTLKNAIHTSGIGLHSGTQVNLSLHPAEENTGIVFRRQDKEPPILIPANTAYVADTRLNTSLANAGVAIATVEHLLSAFAGLGIDNAYIDVAAGELPAMDGSAEPFVALMQSAGIVEQAAAKQFLRILHPVSVHDGDKYVSLEPYEGFKFSLTIDFDHPIIANTQQTVTLDFSTQAFIHEVSSARTFGFLSEYEYLRKNNLGLGASLENTLVLDEKQVLNESGLRYADEFARHKMLDAIGDLYLLGHNFIGSFTGYKSGHTLNHRLREALLADPSAWELVTLDQSDKLSLSFYN